MDIIYEPHREKDSPCQNTGCFAYIENARYPYNCQVLTSPVHPGGKNCHFCKDRTDYVRARLALESDKYPEDRSFKKNAEAYLEGLGSNGACVCQNGGIYI